MRWWHLAIGPVCAGVTALAVAQDVGRGQLPPEAPPILQRALRSSDTLRYTGVRLVSFRKPPDRVEFKEFIIKDGPRTRIEFPDESPYAGQIIVETPSERRHYFPDTNEIRVAPPRRGFALGRLASGPRRSEKGKIKFSTRIGDKVAGRETILALVSDEKGNVLQRLWIDEATALILKREMFDAVGSPVAVFEFTRVNYSARIAPEDFVIRRVGAVVLTPRDLAKRLCAEHKMLPVFLPDSSQYVLESSRITRIGEVPVFVQFYRRGDLRLSLYQIAGATRPDRGHRPRDIESYSWTRDGRSFSLVGKLSRIELEKLAEPIRVR